MISEEMNAVRVFETKIVIKIYGDIKEEIYKIRTNKDIQSILHEADVKFIKSPR
jgi:hypothetical protein